jgi:hypothetical protein
MGEANAKMDAHVRGTLLLYPDLTFEDLVWVLETDLGRKVYRADVKAALRRIGKEAACKQSL